jgi:sulfoxide reductase catalytic subunit YedY
MWTRRKFLINSILIPPFFSKFVSTLWAQAKKILPKEFKKEELKNMNPAEIDNRNLEIDPLDKFGTMGPTDVAVDIKTYRLKVTGAVERPLLLSYDQILKYPSLTEVVLLICPGFFSNNGRWTGVSLKVLLQQAQVKKEAKFLDVKGANEKVVRISLRNIDLKKIFLAYRVNGDPLPKKHGFPLRLVYEGVNGSDWIKYVDEVVVL